LSSTEEARFVNRGMPPHDLYLHPDETITQKNTRTYNPPRPRPISIELRLSGVKKKKENV